MLNEKSEVFSGNRGSNLTIQSKISIERTRIVTNRRANQSQLESQRQKNEVSDAKIFQSLDHKDIIAHNYQSKPRNKLLYKSIDPRAPSHSRGLISLSRDPMVTYKNLLP